MMQHFYCTNGFLQEEVVDTRDYNLQQTYNWREKVNLFELKDEINACRKDIDEMQKNINKNDCVIKRLFSRKKD